MTNEQAKLNALMENEGYSTLEELYEECIFDSLCPTICMNEDCDYTSDMEGDQKRGWCEGCETNSMKSALILGGLI